MRDCFELVELALYMVGIALILPVLQRFDRESPVGFILLLALVSPIPFYLARLRYSFPQRLDQAFETYAYVTFFAGLAVLLVVLIASAFGWTTSVS